MKRAWLRAIAGLSENRLRGLRRLGEARLPIGTLLRKPARHLNFSRDSLRSTRSRFFSKLDKDCRNAKLRKSSMYPRRRSRHDSRERGGCFDNSWPRTKHEEKKYGEKNHGETSCEGKTREQPKLTKASNSETEPKSTGA
ncbi:MAG: hypothetical protein RL591_1504 [Planctomycetota bacterium]